MPAAYFLKELVSNPFYVSGRRVAFEDFGDDKGGIVTEDEGLIAEFRKAIATRRGGIQETDSNGFADAKKKASANASRRSSQSLANNVSQSPALLRQKKDGLAAAVANRGARSTPDYDAMRVKIPKTPLPDAPKIPVGQKLEVPKELPPPAARRPRTRKLSEIAVTPDPVQAATVATP